MDFLTQKLIAIGRSLRADLKAIHNDLAGIQRRLDEQKEAIREAANSSEAEPEATPIELRLPRTVQTHTVLDTKNNEPFEWLKFAVSLFGLLAVIGYTTLAAFQLTEMRKATTASEQAATAAGNAVTDSRDNAHRDLRAWLGVDDPVIKNLSGNPSFELTVFNSGKTPAVNVRTRVDWKYSHDSSIPICKSLSKLVATFDAPFIAPQGKYKLREPTKYPRIADDATRNYWDKPVDEGGGFFCIFGEITYADFKGEPHLTHFCLYARPNEIKDVGYCEQFNDLN